MPTQSKATDYNHCKIPSCCCLRTLRCKLSTILLLIYFLPSLWPRAVLPLRLSFPFSFSFFCPRKRAEESQIQMEILSSILPGLLRVSSWFEATAASPDIIALKPIPSNMLDSINQQFLQTAPRVHAHCVFHKRVIEIICMKFLQAKRKMFSIEYGSTLLQPCNLTGKEVDLMLFSLLSEDFDSCSWRKIVKPTRKVNRMV